MPRDRQGRQHHQEADDRERGCSLLLAADIRMSLRRACCFIRDCGIEPVERKTGRRILVSVSVQEVAILGIQKKLQQGMVVWGRGTAAILGGEKEEPDQRQDPEWRYPARKPDFCPQAWHECHRQELTAMPERQAATIARKVPRSRCAPMGASAIYILLS